MVASPNQLTADFIAEAERCVTCGLCLPHCPTYQKTGSEADSPRGRIQLMNAVVKGVLPANARFKAHIDLCLSCRACEASCPNGVRYGMLIDHARAVVAQPRPIYIGLIQKLFDSRGLRRSLMSGLRMLQRMRILHLFGRFSSRMAEGLAFVPEIPKQASWKSVYPTRLKQKKGDVALFLGCVSDAMDTDTLRASIYVLNRLGYDVHVPPEQTCCGGIARQQGAIEKADLQIAGNREAFASLLDMPVLSTASGCGVGLKDYLGRPVIDVSDFLSQCDWSELDITPLPKKVLVHDPCTLKNVMKSAQAVYRLLEKIPQVTVKPLPGNMQCCGGAGAYMLTQPLMAQSLLQDKLDVMQMVQPDILATSNIGCALQLGKGLRQAHQSPILMHPVMIIAQQVGFKGKI